MSARAIRATMPVPAERADAYRAARLWDDRCLRDGVERAAERRPDALAVADAGRSWTWEEVSRRVTAGVGLLLDAGVRPGGSAVLVAGNTADGVVAYHALLRTGATAVVLDRGCGHADVRRARQVAGPDATVVLPRDQRERLLRRGWVSRMVRAGLRSIEIEQFGEIAPARSAEPRWPEPDRDAPAVVLFTSGTTRDPKAVVHSLNTLTAGARNLAFVTQADSDTVAFLVSPLTSIAGIMQMHLAADTHAALVLEDRFDAETSLDRIDAHGATLLGGAPVIAERLLQAAAARPDRKIALRTLAFGGTMLPAKLLELATDAFGISVVRVYGSSEAPNSCGTLPGDEREQRLRNDGAPLPGTEVRVGSREYGHQQEALLRGPAVFLGYVDAADTAAAFEDGWYRTGDLVLFEAGRLTVAFRYSDAIKRNGLSISLAEVDAALADLPGVVEHACFGVPDEATGERLAVAIRPQDGCEPTLDTVARHLDSAGVAVRKRPEQLVIWNEPLPRTPSGKIVRSRLAAESAGKVSRLAARLDDPPRVLPTPEDHVAIADLLARYCLALDRDDVEGWVALFLPDARYEVYGRSFDGHEGLRRMMGAAPGGLHLGGPPVVEMAGPDRARTERNLLFVDRATGESRRAVYTDELRRTAAGWRIAHTRCQFLVADGLRDRP